MSSVIQVATTEALEQEHAILDHAFIVSTIFKDLRANCSVQEWDELLNNEREERFDAPTPLEYEADKS